MQGRVAWIVQFIGLSTLLGWLSVGGSLMATIYVGSIDLLHSWTREQQAAFLFGFFVVVFVLLRMLVGELRLILRWATHGTAWHTAPIVDSEAAGVREAVEAMHKTMRDAFGPSEQAPPPFRFDHRAILVDRPRIDLAGLFNPEPTFTLYFNMLNVSGLLVEITGVSGRLNIAGQQCQLQNFVTAPGELHSGIEYKTLTIEQPVTTETKNRLIEYLSLETGAIALGCDGLSFVGSVHGPNGAEALKGAHVTLPGLYIRGPIRTREQAAGVTGWETLFADQAVYNHIGERID